MERVWGGGFFGMFRVLYFGFMYFDIIVIYLRLFFDRIKLNVIYGIFKNFIKFCVVILKFEINLI